MIIPIVVPFIIYLKKIDFKPYLDRQYKTRKWLTIFLTILTILFTGVIWSIEDKNSIIQFSPEQIISQNLFLTILTMISLISLILITIYFQSKKINYDDLNNKLKSYKDEEMIKISEVVKVNNSDKLFYVYMVLLVISWILIGISAIIVDSAI